MKAVFTFLIIQEAFYLNNREDAHMNDKIMEQATFSEICKILKDGKSDLCECISGIFNIALLFFPGFVCKEVSFLTNIANGTTILGAKAEIEKSVDRLIKTFDKKSYEDFTTKYEQAQIAQVLIVFAAYFDSMKMYLPDEEKRIHLSATEKCALTEKSIAEYMDFLSAKSLEKADAGTKDLFEYDLSIPNPVEGMENYTEYLQVFYNSLNREFMLFYEKLSFFEELTEPQKERFLAVIRELPAIAAENYKKQYYQLAATFQDFFVWTNMQQHEELGRKIDIGFAGLTQLLTTYQEKAKSTRALSTLEKYTIKYQCAIDAPVIDTSEMDYDSAENVVFPAKKDIFVPQRFKALIYKNPIHLESPETWKKCDEARNIGKFTGDVLRHPVTGSLPLLILGHPGAGKSLLCNMLAARILFHEYHVIIVRLRDTIADQTIRQQINEQIERDFANGCTWDEIAESGLQKPLLIIFDGYDELLQASGRTYSNYLQKIAEFQREARNFHHLFVKCIITSRITLIDKAIITNNTPVIMLSDFESPEIGNWIRIWNGHNEDYFAKNNLEPFEIPTTSKVSGLAGQPLLLLMLALFDSNGNALKKNKDLNSTQLYDKLIREFISREKRKDESFRNRQSREQESLIEEEMQKISIAALSMYNRKALYIRADELEKDLHYILPKETAGQRLPNSGLSESDKLLGSFFFIHRSDSSDLLNKEKLYHSAYEFLHNTFGEFLTANYIVSEMYNILSWIQLLLQRRQEYQWNPENQKSWMVCLSYAPLFSRPVVIKMIHEWAGSYFHTKGMDRKQTDAAFDFLIGTELERVLHGEAIFTLKRILDEKENPYPQEEMLKHLAVYALNLMMLRIVTYHNDYCFPFPQEIRNKLIALWKYAFSEDELSNYSDLFRAENTKNGFLVDYIGNKRNHIADQDRLLKLMGISSALGDETLYGIIATLLGTNSPEQIDGILDRNSLHIKARYWWSYVLGNLSFDKMPPDKLLYMLSDFYNHCMKEDDIENLFSFYLLLNFLLKINAVNAGSKTNDFLLLCIVTGLGVCDKFNYISHRFRNEDSIPFYIQKLSIELLDFAKPGAADIENIFLSCFHGFQNYGYEYEALNISRLYNGILQKMTASPEKIKFMRSLSDDSYMNIYINEALSALRDKNTRARKLIFNNLEITYRLLLLGKYQESLTIFKRCIEAFEMDGMQYAARLTQNQKILLIDYLYEMHQKQYLGDSYVKLVLFNIIRNVNIAGLFDSSPETAGRLLSLPYSQMIMNQERLSQDLLSAVTSHGDTLSIRLYRQIRKFAQEKGMRELIDLLDGMFIL